MADTSDMIIPMLREMRMEIAGQFKELRAETNERFDVLDRRPEAVEAPRKSFKRALTADTLLSRLLAREFGQRIETLEARVEGLEARK